MSTAQQPAEPTATVAVYSHDPVVRERIRVGVGRRPAPDVGRIRFVDASTVRQIQELADHGEVDLLLLDAEAQPTGGMGIARTLKNEIEDCPPAVVVVQRPQDRWLATWSEADAVLSHPLDPVQAAATVAEILRARLGIRTGTDSQAGALPAHS
jgi:DNA-binding response OmpR family regulator